MIRGHTAPEAAKLGLLRKRNISTFFCPTRPPREQDAERRGREPRRPVGAVSRTRGPPTSVAVFLKVSYVLVWLEAPCKLRSAVVPRVAGQVERSERVSLPASSIFGNISRFVPAGGLSGAREMRSVKIGPYLILPGPFTPAQPVWVFDKRRCSCFFLFPEVSRGSTRVLLQLNISSSKLIHCDRRMATMISGPFLA